MLKHLAFALWSLMHFISVISETKLILLPSQLQKQYMTRRKIICYHIVRDCFE